MILFFEVSFSWPGVNSLDEKLLQTLFRTPCVGVLSLTCLCFFRQVRQLWTRPEITTMQRWLFFSPKLSRYSHRRHFIFIEKLWFSFTEVTKIKTIMGGLLLCKTMDRHFYFQHFALHTHRFDLPPFKLCF